MLNENFFARASDSGKKIGGLTVTWLSQTPLLKNSVSSSVHQKSLSMNSKSSAPLTSAKISLIKTPERPSSSLLKCFKKALPLKKPTMANMARWSGKPPPERTPKRSRGSKSTSQNPSKSTDSVSPATVSITSRLTISRKCLALTTPASGFLHCKTMALGKLSPLPNSPGNHLRRILKLVELPNVSKPILQRFAKRALITLLLVTLLNLAQLKSSTAVAQKTHVMKCHLLALPSWKETSDSTPLRKNPYAEKNSQIGSPTPNTPSLPASW